MLQKGSLLLLLGIGVFCQLALAQGRVAIVGGTLINVRDGSLVPGAVIVTEGDRIVSVSSGGQAPAGATVVDARGKYVVPGFIDAMGSWKYWAGELFVNHGVTTTRAGASDWTRAQAALIENGTIVGPRILHGAGFSGPRRPLDVLMRTTVYDRVYINQMVSRNQLSRNQRGGSGSEPTQDSNVIRNVAEAREAMKKYVSGQVKVDSLSVSQSVENPEIVRAVAEEARKANIPLVGHSANARLAADVGYSGIDHSWQIGVALLDAQAREKAMRSGKMTKGYIPRPESFMDMKKAPDLAKYMAEKGVVWIPGFREHWGGTEGLLKKDFMRDEVDLLFGDWRLRYVPLEWKIANIKELYEIDIWHRNDLTQYDRDLYEQGYKNSLAFVKILVDAGGKVAAGTDCASFCVPGLDTHQEIQLFVEDAGITPLQALQAATIWSADALRQDRLGVIEEGKAADIVILDANPLENIRNTRKIAKVIARGRILDGQYHADFTNPIMPPMGDQPHRDGSSHFFPNPRIDQVSLRGATLTVEGTGFIPYSLVVLNGQKIKTEFIDQFQLKATVPAELLKTGTFPVTVESPDAGSAMLRSGLFGNVSNTFVVLFNIK